MLRPPFCTNHSPLSGESSAYYHGYILAEMAVYQTREHFLARDGFLTDNPRIGPDLAMHYWAPGNAVPFDDTVQSLIGASLSADALARECNLSVDHAIAEARANAAIGQRRPRTDAAVELDATIHVVHGHERIASTDEGGIDGLCAAFESWIDRLERSASSQPD